MFAVVVAVTFLLFVYVPFTRWSWVSWAAGGELSGGGNVALLPVTLPYVGILFAVLLFLNFPLLARIEEDIFRAGTRTWRQACWRSTLFGLAHCLVGVPISAGLALIVAGLWFSRQYMRGVRKTDQKLGGVLLSTLHHTAYNIVVLAIFGTVVLLFALL